MDKWTDLKFWTSKRYFDILSDMDEDVLPCADMRYTAFTETPYDTIRCVILGQDPYHTPGVATGLAFSVNPHTKIPPSLRNIIKEYRDDLGYPNPRSGSLLSWARNGVLLLNTALSVRKGEPGSHKDIGWGRLTTEVLMRLSEHHERLVFILWGQSAQEYRGLIDEDKHMVVTSSHPSPFSADRGFFGSKPFTRTNSYLDKPINWRL